MAPTYRVEELLAVRHSVSESAVSLEKFGDEDAIKEHVLRPSVSVSAIAQKRLHSDSEAQIRPAPVNTATPKEISLIQTTAKKPSPSPSIKKAKVEKLLKQHGSPPGRRVTAGGRIVPTDFSFGGPPSNYGFSMLHQFQHSAQPNARSLSDLPNGFVAYDKDGRFCQLVDGEMREVRDGQLYIAPPNLPFPIVSPPPAHAALMTGASDPYHFQQHQQGGEPANPSFDFSDQPAIFDLGENKMSLTAQIQFVEKSYEKLRRDFNQLERLEVIRENQLTADGRAQVVEQKREYVKQLDKLRKLKNDLENKLHGDGPPSIAPSNWVQSGLRSFPSLPAPQYPIHAFMQANMSANSFYPQPTQYSMPNGGVTPGVHAGNSMFKGPTAPIMNNPTYGALGISFPASHSNSQGSTGFGMSENDDQISPKSAGSHQDRRSHAVEIKAPSDGGTKVISDSTIKTGAKSALDPTSPTYEPRNVFIPPSPSPVNAPASHPITQNSWLDQSDTSVSTTNFFPMNPEEYSQTKHSFTKPVDAPAGAERSAFSGQIHTTTPQKDWARNSYAASQAGTPDVSDGRQLKAPGPVSPIEHRMSSWNRDIMPSFEPVSPMISPEQSRIASEQRINGSNCLTTRNSLHNTPTRPSLIAATEGKSLEWAEGYLNGMMGREFDELPSSNEFRAGYYQGASDCERNTRGTPDKGVSRRSSQLSVRDNVSLRNTHSHPALNDSSIRSPYVPFLQQAGGFAGRVSENVARVPISPAAVSPNKISPDARMVSDSALLTSMLQTLPYDTTRAELAAGTYQREPAGARRAVSTAMRPPMARGQSASAAVVSQPAPTKLGDGEWQWKEAELQEVISPTITAPARLSNGISGNRTSSNSFTREYPGHKMYATSSDQRRYQHPIGTRRPLNNSQVDGADEVTPAKKTSSSPEKLKQYKERIQNKVRSHWRGQFQAMKKRDREEARKYREENPLA